MPNNHIHIALCFDDNFWAPAYATMRSVCLATKRRKDLNFHLCHRTLSKEHIADLEKITTEFGSTLHYYNIDESDLFNEVAARARYNKRLSNIVYARLLFAELLPKSVKRLVYLDCDMYVRIAIERLAAIDLDGNAIAAVQDFGAPIITSGRDFRGGSGLFDVADPYFNAGMLLIDMGAWRKANVRQRLEDAIADGTMDRIYYDQDFLNLTFHGNWLQLDGKWNVLDPRKPHMSMDPYILHYTGRWKPWQLLSQVAYARMYRHVMTNELFYRYFRYRLKKRFTF